MSDSETSRDAPHATVTVRIIMNGKEVGSIIGKGGEIVNSIREESGAKVHISDGSVPERIVTVSGSIDAIYKAYSKICRKFESDGPKDDEGGGGGGVPRPPVTLRLVVPASQCGSLIGKGGCKIKEIREETGASIQVASDMLPNSTERTVTISGSGKAITQCIYSICCVMLECPPKGTTIPYTPKSGMGGGGGFMSAAGSRGGGHRHSAVQDNPLASLLGLNGGGGGGGGGGSGSSTLAAIASLAGSQIRDRRHSEDRGGGGSTQTYEMSIPNDMIGCIIGKGGSKIAEIRQLSGAMIRISKSDDHNNSEQRGDGDKFERQITISGHPDSVALAKSLINMSLDLHKSKLEERSGDDDSGNRRGGNYHRSGDRNTFAATGGATAAVAANLGLAQLLAKPDALTALTTLASFSNLGGLGGGLLAGLGGAGSSGLGGGGGYSVSGLHRSRGGYGGGSGSRGRDDDRGRDSKRSKFAPY